jgi:hypothetical protein
METHCGALVRALKSIYERHGTLNLFAALEVASGQVYTQITLHKKREDLRDFPGRVNAELPRYKGIIRLILDNYSMHKKNNDWLAQYEGRVFATHRNLAKSIWQNPSGKIRLDRRSAR